MGFECYRLIASVIAENAEVGHRGKMEMEHWIHFTAENSRTRSPITLARSSFDKRSVVAPVLCKAVAFKNTRLD
jgi:hypothetical protein